MDPDYLADALASADSHLILDIPLELADKLRDLLADRESEIAALRGKLDTAELALMSMTARVAASVPAFDGVPHEDDGWCGVQSLRFAGAL